MKLFINNFLFYIFHFQIGQGRFGKVYTAVNNTTGELMAMKEIAMQAGVSRAIQKVTNELKIFEGINHRHLVKYYGIEIHRVSDFDYLSLFGNLTFLLNF